jgi:hypothetical protein
MRSTIGVCALLPHRRGVAFRIAVLRLIKAVKMLQHRRSEGRDASGTATGRRVYPSVAADKFCRRRGAIEL